MDVMKIIVIEAIKRAGLPAIFFQLLVPLSAFLAIWLPWKQVAVVAVLLELVVIAIGVTRALSDSVDDQREKRELREELAKHTPRTLTLSQREILIRELRKIPAGLGQINAEFIRGNLECASFCQEIFETIALGRVGTGDALGGWRNEIPTIERIPIGIAILVKDPMNPPQNVFKLFLAFKDAGILPCELESRVSMKDGNWILCVGAKPI